MNNKRNKHTLWPTSDAHTPRADSFTLESLSLAANIPSPTRFSHPSTSTRYSSHIIRRLLIQLGENAKEVAERTNKNKKRKKKKQPNQTQKRKINRIKPYSISDIQLDGACVWRTYLYLATCTPIYRKAAQLKKPGHLIK